MKIELIPNNTNCSGTLFAVKVCGFIDDVILRHETRMRICRSLVMLKDKKIGNSWRKHGNIPL
jgi:propionyl-CoA carboxylase beta chain